MPSNTYNNSVYNLYRFVVFYVPEDNLQCKIVLHFKYIYVYIIFRVYMVCIRLDFTKLILVWLCPGMKSIALVVIEQATL